MEVYFKELISKEASLEKLVEDLEKVVQGTDDFARSLGETYSESGPEIARRLRRLKEKCQDLKLELVARAQATDRMIRNHPYSFLAAAALAGTAIGFVLRRRR